MPNRTYLFTVKNRNYMDFEVGANYRRNYGNFWLNTKMHAAVFQSWGQLGPWTQASVAEIRTRWFPNGPGVGGVDYGGYAYTFHIKFKKEFLE